MRRGMRQALQGSVVFSVRPACAVLRRPYADKGVITCGAADAQTDAPQTPGRITVFQSGDMRHAVRYLAGPGQQRAAGGAAHTQGKVRQHTSIKGKSTQIVRGGRTQVQHCEQHRCGNSLITMCEAPAV